MKKILRPIYNRFVHTRFFKDHITKRKIYQKYEQYRKRHSITKKCIKIPELIKQIEDSGKIPLFSYVEIETQNRCNGTCSFCPVNKKDDPREHLIMSEELFSKIISELESINYSGSLNLFSNNEPFLDERIETFAEKARKALPGAFIRILTNGTLLSLERFKNIILHIDYLRIDNYNDKLEYNKTTQIIYDYCLEHPDIGKKVEIELIRLNAIRGTRAGQAPNNKGKKSLPALCLMPYNQMVIRPDGKVSLCCNDVFGTFTLGDISKDRMVDVWYNEEYKKFRSAIKNGRAANKLCKYCDTSHPGIWGIGEEYNEHFM